MSFDEFMDALRVRYGLKTLGLCNVCDDCNAPFTVAHALSCKRGELVSIRHNDARDEAGPPRKPRAASFQNYLQTRD